MHNINCNSFTVAVDILGNDRKIFLLSFLDDSQRNYELEEQYIAGYRNLFLQSQKKILDKFQKKKEDIDFKFDFLKSQNEKLIFLIDSQRDLLENLVSESAIILKKHDIDQIIINEILDNFVKRIKEFQFYDPNSKSYSVNMDLIKKIIQ